MTTTIETVFEKGVFRPLQPVEIPENRRVKISLEDKDLAGDKQPILSLPVGEYPLESLGDDIDYQSVPLSEVGKLEVRCVYAGEVPPLPYPED